MTLLKAMETFDRERDNALSIEAKVDWLSQLDMKISAEILADRGGEKFEGYSLDTPFDCVLKAPDEYGEIYGLYLNMKLDYMNGEIARFNNSAMLFNRMFKELHDYINRKTPVTKKTSLKAGGIYV